jgi:hypothetical protein
MQQIESVRRDDATASTPQPLLLLQRQHEKSFPTSDERNQRSADKNLFLDQQYSNGLLLARLKHSISCALERMIAIRGALL